MTNDTKRVSRRTVIKTTGVAAAASLAGCNSGGEGTASGTVEILHAWSGGDGEAALNALVDGFDNDSISINAEAVEGAARGNLVEAIQNQIESGDPPDTWQAWPGKNLLRFNPDDYGDLGEDVFTDDVRSQFLEGPRNAAQVGDKFVAVPLNIHRINNLFYNTNVLDDAGVDPESLSSPSDVVNAMGTVESQTDATPHAHALAGWTTGQLWETVLLAQGGPDEYTNYINGEGDEEVVSTALETVEDMLEYIPDDASSIGFTEANSRFQNDEAAFIHQGDWAAGAYAGNDDFNYGEDWGNMAFPGSSGNYALNMDSFPLPADAPNPEAAKEFLSYCASTEAQLAFNGEKGSIPPRKDADVSELNQFQQDQFDDFTNSDNQPPSIAHGAAVVPPVKTNFDDAFASFIESRDVDSATDDLMNAFN